MNLYNLAILHIIKPLWLRKILASLIGFAFIYILIIFNRETAFMLSLLISAVIYRNLRTDQQNFNDKSNQPFYEVINSIKNVGTGIAKNDCVSHQDTIQNNQSQQDSQNSYTAQTLVVDKKNIPQIRKNYGNYFVIDQFIASLFCACFLVFNNTETYALEAVCACVFIRIYDYYKPSFIRRFYNFKPNLEGGYIFSGLLNGILSGLSIMLIIAILQKFNIIQITNLL
ncbi:hypothetical protein CQA53_00565 [Helicobacter didelphidarum]|uniref:Uncharacterized protein n=1 Tax=Helicobacter didelphidarum TaxID=2040648 RepID=A0A3D8IRJ2_9HELI|nr:hypothetical protein [Helicobacter didelphidarum]RDU67546.1 hypothetical protein CQA53_00565 [Helicobacter didelphidarum]